MKKITILLITVISLASCGSTAPCGLANSNVESTKKSTLDKENNQIKDILITEVTSETNN